MQHLFAAYERFHDVGRAAMISQLGRQARRAQLAARTEFSREALGMTTREAADHALWAIKTTIEAGERG